jgi:SAM-dependent methyltransferase
VNEIEILRTGYRQLGTKFDEWRDRIADDPRAEWRDLLASKLEPGARVLELGCGAGDSGLQHFDLTGVDLVARAPGVVEAGFAIESDEIVTIREPEVEGDGRFQWILARR